MHPTSDALCEYACLDVVLNSEIQRHLTACPSCLALFTDARSYLPESEPEAKILEALLEDPEVVSDAARWATNGMSGVRESFAEVQGWSQAPNSLEVWPEGAQWGKEWPRIQ